jgi:anti-sigma regulatory factor (Ser/Thr protein kinase)
MATTPVGRRKPESRKRRERETADTGVQSWNSNGGPGAIDSAPERSAHDPRAAGEVQLDELLAALRAVRSGDFSARLNTRRGGLPWLSNTGASPDDVFAITLAANEACSNAIEHAYGPESGSTFRLLAKRSSDVIVIKISDSGRWRTPRGSERGRGLRIIEHLMDAVDVQRTATGTTVRMRKALADH